MLLSSRSISVIPFLSTPVVPLSHPLSLPPITPAEASVERLGGGTEIHATVISSHFITSPPSCVVPNEILRGIGSAVEQRRNVRPNMQEASDPSEQVA